MTGINGENSDSNFAPRGTRWDRHDLAFGPLLVNGVDVVPLVEAELNRQFPGRELQKSTTPQGLRDGWVAVQAAWQRTVDDTPADLVDAHVEDEWSLAQTLRHLVLATDAWLRGAILQVPLRYIRRDLALLR